MENEIKLMYLGGGRNRSCLVLATDEIKDALMPKIEKLITPDRKTAEKNRAAFHLEGLYGRFEEK
ncbi:hypothetical protein, partial [Thermogutta sp.]|uniref:hypothetical protein n=1 Tax=Thermogutta sp. TaxID=1962930 RepID=UPI00321FEAFC